MGSRTTVSAALALLVTSCQTPDHQPRREPDWAAARAAMVRDQLRGRDVQDPRVLDAMSRVPRHLFVPDAGRADAYGDFPLPIGYGQTISQPYIVGFMSQALEVETHHRVLEIGTGSGYQAAILAELAREVYTIEIVAPLAELARKTLEAARLHERANQDWKRVSRMARARAVRSGDGDCRARRGTASPGRAASRRRSHGHPRRHDRSGD